MIERINRIRNKRAALKFANQLRKDTGLPRLSALPKGRRMKPLTCPLGRAIEGSVGAGCAHLDGQVIWLPVRVASFVNDFDRGLYPELIQ